MMIWIRQPNVSQSEVTTGDAWLQIDGGWLESNDAKLIVLVAEYWVDVTESGSLN